MRPPVLVLAGLLANLDHAARNHMPASIGGGVFTPGECEEIADCIRALQKRRGGKARTVACVICKTEMKGSARARAAGWVVLKYGTRAVCPTCDSSYARPTPGDEPDWRDEQKAEEAERRRKIVDAMPIEDVDGLRGG